MGLEQDEDKIHRMISLNFWLVMCLLIHCAAQILTDIVFFINMLPGK